MTNYLLGLATPILLAYIGFGIFIMKENWGVHPSEHWISQYRSPYTDPPLFVRSWPVFLALWIPTPLLWPITMVIGKWLNWRYRHAHNTAAAAARGNAD